MTASNVSQIEMFKAPAIQHKIAAFRALYKLDFSQCLDNLKHAGKIDPSLADIRALKIIVTWLGDLFHESAGATDFMVRAWQALPAAVMQRQLTQNQALFVNKLLVKIAAENRIGQSGPFWDKREQLHLGCFQIITGEWEQARKALLETVSTTHAQRGDLWGYYGDVNMLLGNTDEASLAYVCALILNPAQLDLFRLQSKSLKNLLRRLLSAHSEGEARNLLFIHGYLQGILTVPGKETWLSHYAREMTHHFGDKESVSRAERWRWFSVYLYLDRSCAGNEINYRARERMQDLDKTLFEKYLDRLKAGKV